jgi:hypothetical protein
MITINPELNYIFLLFLLALKKTSKAGRSLTTKRHELINRLNDRANPPSFCWRGDTLFASYCLVYDECLVHSHLLRALAWFFKSVVEGVRSLDADRLVKYNNE